MPSASLLDVLVRRWRVVAAFLAVSIALAVAALGATQTTYAAQASLIVSQPQARGVNEALQGVQLSSQLLQSFAAVATSRTAAELVREHLGLSLTTNQVRERLAAAPQAETLLLTISAVDTDPVRARDLANEASQVLIDQVQKFAGSQFDQVKVTVVDEAQLGTRAGPSTSRFLVVGFLLGAVLGAVGALLRDRLDRTIKSPVQAAAALHVPVLGLIPRQPTKALDPGSVLDEPQSALSEAFRSLRTAVTFAELESPIRTLLITSPSPNEGKTTVATNLAVALAQGGQRVVLVDGDLRRGSVVDLLGLPGGAGITSVIRRQASLEEVLLGWRGMLTVLGTGALPPNPSEIVGSQAVSDLLHELRRRADVVIIDGAPILPVTDSVVLSTQVDGVLMVTRHGATTRAAAVEAAHRLETVGARVIGCVFNATPRTLSTGYYYYDEDDSGTSPVPGSFGLPWKRRTGRPA